MALPPNIKTANISSYTVAYAYTFCSPSIYLGNDNYGKSVELYHPQTKSCHDYTKLFADYTKLFANAMSLYTLTVYTHTLTVHSYIHILFVRIGGCIEGGGKEKKVPKKTKEVKVAVPSSAAPTTTSRDKAKKTRCVFINYMKQRRYSRTSPIRIAWDQTSSES